LTAMRARSGIQSRNTLPSHGWGRSDIVLGTSEQLVLLSIHKASSFNTSRFWGKEMLEHFTFKISFSSLN